MLNLSKIKLLIQTIFTLKLRNAWILTHIEIKNNRMLFNFEG